MDEVLHKRYRGKLECREADLVDHLPPPQHLDQLTLTTAAPVSPVVGGIDISWGNHFGRLSSFNRHTPDWRLLQFR